LAFEAPKFGDTGNPSGEQYQGPVYRLALERFLKSKKAEGRDIKNYYYLSAMWLPALGDRALVSITPDDIEAILDEATVSHNYKPASRHQALRVLSALFSFAVNRDWLFRNPCMRVKKPILRNARTRWLRPKEVDAIVANSPTWLRVIIRAGVGTGFRLSELCSLRVSNYETDGMGRAFIISNVTKNGEIRKFPAEGWLRDYCEARRVLGPSDAFLFPGPYGGKAKASIRRYMPAAVRAAGLKWGRNEADGVVFHTLRHSFASILVSSNVSLTVVKELGGWKTLSMVQRYSHLADEVTRSASSHLDRILNPEQPK